jgi:hypothetical protein
MHVAIKQITFAVRDSVTRVPFRYGTACLTECPQAVLEVVAETDHATVRGYSGDCLPPAWFDKSPGKSFAQQLADMYQAVRMAASCYGDAFRTPQPFFFGWHNAHQQTMQAVEQCGLPALLAAFASSFLERALMDAICRICGLPLFQALRWNVFGIRGDLIHPELRGQQPQQWLPQQPRPHVWVRQTVGLGDPLTETDAASGNWPQDGFPISLEQYIRDYGVRYFKMKLSSDQEQNLCRLSHFAELAEKYLKDDYYLTLDGNELYHDPAAFQQLVDVIQRHDRLGILWNNVIAIEQPFPRDIAFRHEFAAIIKNLSNLKPIIIDESDSQLTSFRTATEIGYRGVSSKNCKGSLKSILNAGLVAYHNSQHAEHRWLMTGEDLCSVGVIAVQSDLCLAAALGLEHVERNGHHYHRGISYLPDEEQQEALLWHPDFYTKHAGRISPRLIEGKFHIASLQCAGFGFAVLPRMNQRREIFVWQP